MASDAVKMHRDHCRAVQADVEEKLGRALTEPERLKIWNCLSAQMRETLDMTAYYAKAPQDVERALAEFSTYPALPNEFTRTDGELLHNPPMQRTVAAGIVTFLRKMLGRGPGH